MLWNLLAAYVCAFVYALPAAAAQQAPRSSVQTLEQPIHAAVLRHFQLLHMQLQDAARCDLTHSAMAWLSGRPACLSG